MLKKIQRLFSRRKKNAGTGSAFSQNLQRSGYQASHLERGGKKPSLWKRFYPFKKNRGQHTNGILVQERSGKLVSLAKVALLSVALLTGNYFLLMGPMQAIYGDWRYFRIHEIEMSGCRLIDADVLRKYADISYEMNMLTLDPGDIRKRLLEHPWVRTAEVKRVWPDRLMVNVREYQAQALVMQEGGEGFSYLNSRATVFAAVKPGQELDFPVITGIGSTDTEEQKERMFRTANSFLRLAGQNNPSLAAQNVSEIHFTDTGDLIIYLVEYPFPIYFGTGEIDRKFGQLWRVLEALYKKKRGKANIDEVAYIRMDYQNNKVLVVRNNAG